ncbi:MAG: FRG domain-containing protein [Vicinamibacterales bacterium]
MANWLDIVDELYAGAWNADLQRFRSPFAFRGASSVQHTLASSLVRLAGGRADVRRLELALLRNFRKYAHAEVTRQDSIWDWLALGQHRGLPTRLLDWTYSPLVALHFATDDPETFDVDGVVWCVNFIEANKQLPPRLRRILEQEGSDTFTVEMLGAFTTLKEFDALKRDPFVVFMEPPAVDRRILNQLALFSLMSRPDARLDDWLERHPKLCRKVRIPASLKWEIRDKLDQANVNERVLFPGLDGLSRWLARYYTPAGDAGRVRPPAVPARTRTRGGSAVMEAAPPGRGISRPRQRPVRRRV